MGIKKHFNDITSTLDKVGLEVQSITHRRNGGLTVAFQDADGHQAKITTSVHCKRGRFYDNLKTRALRALDKK